MLDSTWPVTLEEEGTWPSSMYSRMLGAPELSLESELSEARQM